MYGNTFRSKTYCNYLHYYLTLRSSNRKIRFWGKILGRPKNYYIVEATLSESEIERKLKVKHTIL